MGTLLPPKVAGDVLMYRDVDKGREFIHWRLSVIAFDKYLPDRAIIYGIPSNLKLADEFLSTKIGFFMTLDRMILKIVVSYPSRRGTGGAKSTYRFTAATQKEGRRVFRRIQAMIMRNHKSYDGLYTVAKFQIRNFFRALGKPDRGKGATRTSRLSSAVGRARRRAKGR